MSTEKGIEEYIVRIQEVLDNDYYKWTKDDLFWNANVDGNEDFCQLISLGSHIQMIFYTRNHINVSNNPYYRSIEEGLYKDYMHVDNIFPNQNQFTNSTPGFGVVVKSLVDSVAWFGGVRDVSVKDFVKKSREIFKELNYYSNAENKIKITNF
ncbi:hypothetical protein [Paenibacillus sp. FJAT-27812]|uniref:hypothetical protein n=1 Tax=Paenibacillus sp. FJAT-27812 TaxID=1684143 RepID=UPI0006A7DBB2|nr:hypothetical protein [Paenibacillus sp. FJAT-27812]